jgi:hypothetical protein
MDPHTVVLHLQLLASLSSCLVFCGVPANMTLDADYQSLGPPLFLVVFVGNNACGQTTGRVWVRDPLAFNSS